MARMRDKRSEARARLAARDHATAVGRAALLDLSDGSLRLLLGWVQAVGLVERAELRDVLGITTRTVPGRTARARPTISYDAPDTSLLRAHIRVAASGALYREVLQPVLQSLAPHAPYFRGTRGQRLATHEEYCQAIQAILNDQALPIELSAAHANLDSARQREAREREARRLERIAARWPVGETRHYNDHQLNRRDARTFVCERCGYDSTQREVPFRCPGKPVYRPGTVPAHFATDRQLRTVDHLRPTAAPVAVLRMQTREGMRMLDLYDRSATTPIARRAPPRRRCGRCDALIPRDASDQRLCAACIDARAAERAAAEQQRWELHAQWAAERAARITDALAALEAERQTMIAPATTDLGRLLLDALHATWTFNRAVKDLSHAQEDIRARWYGYKDVMLQALLTLAQRGECIVVSRYSPQNLARRVGLAEWSVPGSHLYRLDVGQAADPPPFLALERVIPDDMPYLGWVVVYGGARAAFHSPVFSAAWLMPRSWWNTLKERPVEPAGAFTFGGRSLAAHIDDAAEAIIAHEATFTARIDAFVAFVAAAGPLVRGQGATTTWAAWGWDAGDYDLDEDDDDW